MKFIPLRSDGQIFCYGARYGWIGSLVGALTVLPIFLILFYFFDSFIFFGLSIFFGIIGYFVRRIVSPKKSASKRVDGVIW